MPRNGWDILRGYVRNKHITEKEFGELLVQGFSEEALLEILSETHRMCRTKDGKREWIPKDFQDDRK